MPARLLTPRVFGKHNGKRYDVITIEDGSEVWFDISPFSARFE